jgi:hypothetical protein
LLEDILSFRSVFVKLFWRELIRQAMRPSVRGDFVAATERCGHQIWVMFGDPAEEKAGAVNVMLSRQIEQA